MATYNGIEFLDQQLTSIINDLSERDRLIVVDDGSNDGTVNRLKSINDPRVVLHDFCENVGHVRNFERGLAYVEDSRYVALADQDDEWPAGRLNYLEELLGEGVMAAGSADALLDPQERIFEFEERICTSLFARLRNILALFLGRAPYFGSAMAFHARVLELALPFPKTVAAHDHWLAICGNVLGPVAHGSKAVVFRREHNMNLTDPNRTLGAKLLTRVLMASTLVHALRRRVSAATWWSRVTS